MGKTNKAAERMAKAKNKYGAWQVITLGAKMDYVKCECDCGVSKEVNIYSLTSGKSKSCGCGRHKE